MNQKSIVFAFLFFVITFTVFAQGKKDIKKFKIKSITVSESDLNGKVRKDSYQKFDINGNVL